MKTSRWLTFMLTAIGFWTVAPVHALPAGNDLTEYAEEVYYVGCYRDYQGHAGSVFLAKDLERLLILDVKTDRAMAEGESERRAGCPPTLQGIRAGTAGRLSYKADRQSETLSGQPPAEGLFSSFEPGPGNADLVQVAHKTRNPLLMGLLAANSTSQIYPKLLTLKRTSEINRALAGMVMAGALPLAEKYLAANPPERASRDAGDPDFRVLLPWIRQGLEATPAISASAEEMHASPVLALLPAVRTWLATQSREKTAAAFYDTVFGMGVNPALLSAGPEAARGSSAGLPMVFERGDFGYARALRFRAPQLFQILAEAQQDLAYWENVMVLDAVANPDGAYFVFWDRKRGERMALEYHGELPELLFGSRVNVLVRISRPGEFRCGQVIRCQFLEPDPDAMFTEIRQMSPGYRLGYVAKAVGNSQNELSWQDWRELLQKAAEEEGWPRINNAEIFQVTQDTAVADELALSLPAMIRTRGYADAGEQGLRIVAVYLRNGEYEKARGELSSLPEELRSCRESYDGKGDIGWSNRCGIELMRLLLARLSNRKPPRVSRELRRHRDYALDTVRHILITIPGIPLDEWEAHLKKALPASK